MRIGGYDADQVAAVLEMWNINSPIDVAEFLARPDVPEGNKDRVRIAGLDPVPTARDPVDAYRRMQARIMIEVVALDQERWKPLG
jgi:hypothetical protein